MPAYLTPSRVFDHSSPVRVAKRRGETVAATDGTHAVTENRTEHEEAPSTVLTLDDFGGRSDALGG
jgi:hypothetical protein